MIVFKLKYVRKLNTLNYDGPKKVNAGSQKVGQAFLEEVQKSVTESRKALRKLNTEYCLGNQVTEWPMPAAQVKTTWVNVFRHTLSWNNLVKKSRERLPMAFLAETQIG